MIKKWTIHKIIAELSTLKIHISRLVSINIRIILNTKKVRAITEMKSANALKNIEIEKIESAYQTSIVQ